MRHERPLGSCLAAVGTRLNRALRRHPTDNRCNGAARRREALPPALSGVFEQGNRQILGRDSPAGDSGFIIRGTVQPGAAMTVKEMGPAIGASSPALVIFGSGFSEGASAKKAGRQLAFSLRLPRDIPARTAGGNDHCLTRTNIGQLTTPLGRARGGRVAQCRAPNGRPARPRAGRTSRAKRPGAWPRNRRGSARTTRRRRCAGRCRG